MSLLLMILKCGTIEFQIYLEIIQNHSDLDENAVFESY